MAAAAGGVTVPAVEPVVGPGVADMVGGIAAPRFGEGVPGGTLGTPDMTGGWLVGPNGDTGAPVGFAAIAAGLFAPNGETAGLAPGLAIGAVAVIPGAAPNGGIPSGPVPAGGLYGEFAM